jgi:SAM-dependent methyltransferase
VPTRRTSRRARGEPLDVSGGRAAPTRVDPPAHLYGDRVARSYDVDYPERTAEVPADFLAALAGPRGRALELGIGTGRVALPLARRGVRVEGIDASRAMVARLRKKPGGRAIPVSIGDFADVDAKGPFSLVYVVFNTFFALLTQEDQVRCFWNVATRLAPGGTFVIEGFVPDPSRFDRGQRTDTTAIGGDSVDLNCAVHDAARQRVDTRQYRLFEDGRFEVVPISVRYAWPSELDLMARLAGLRLRERYGGFDRRPFGSGSGSHVSVYERPAGGGGGGRRRGA